METINLKVASEFSSAPGPRYIREGDFSGEAFRKEILFSKMDDAIKNNKVLVVDLDGTAGYGTSFLEESFGGLIREDHLDYEKIVKHLKIISTEEPWLVEDVQNYMEDASKMLATA